MTILRQQDELAVQAAVETFFDIHGVFPEDFLAAVERLGSAVSAIERLGWDRVRYERDPAHGYRLTFLGPDLGIRTVEDHESFRAKTRALQDAPDSRSPRLAATAPAEARRSLRILAVEDSEDDVTLMKAELSRAGFDTEIERVETARDMERALTAKTWDVVVSDSSMPGLDVIAALRIAKERSPRTPFLLVSGHVSPETVVIAIRNGAAAYVSKDRLFKLGPSIATVLSTAGEPTELTFRLLFQSSPDCYLVVTTALRIVAVTDSYCKATMTRRPEILGRHLFDVFPDNPQAARANDLRASLERVIDHGAPDSVEVMSYDARQPEDKSAGEHYWKAVNYPVFDASGDLAYIIHRVEDVT